MLEKQEEWVVYRVTLRSFLGSRTAIGCESRANWDASAKYQWGNSRNDVQTAELIAEGLTREQAIQFMLLARGA